MEFITGGVVATALVVSLFITGAIWFTFVDWVEYKLGIDEMLMNFLAFVFLLGGLLNACEGKTVAEIKGQEKPQVEKKIEVTKENGYTVLGD